MAGFAESIDTPLDQYFADSPVDFQSLKKRLRLMFISR
jgi:hypothetical protein